ncbi:MAG: sugar transferase [Ignavibacterium sp.]
MYYRKYFKRIFDVIITLILLVITAPVLLGVGLLLWTTQRKVFYIQARPGKGGKVFQLIKFKTMTDQTDENGKLLPDKDRMTRLGKWLRATSLDELPQLINVLKGDMSLIGPRPLLVKYLPLYSDRQARRHEVRPGITGWAQVNGRNAISWQEKFEYDIFYVENLSFLLDLKIIWLTFIKVIKREGINSDKNATMEPFVGNV